MTTAGSQLSIDVRGPKGADGTSGSGAVQLRSPVDNGLLAWQGAPELMGSNVTCGFGIVFLQRMKVAATGTITRVGLPLRSAAPAGLTNTFVGVYSQSGVTATLLQKSADISSTVNGVSVPTLYNLTASIAATAGDVLLVAYLAGAGTTSATFLGGVGNPNRYIASKQNFWSLAFGTGQTALPSTMDLSSASASDSGAGPNFVLA